MSKKLDEATIRQLIYGRPEDVVMGAPHPPRTRCARCNGFEAENTAMKEVLRDCQRLFKEALPKFDWGRSPLDANAIQLLNTVPGKVRNILHLCIHGNDPSECGICVNTLRGSDE